MSVLSDKKVLIGISGGIAAYKIPILVRLLIKLKSSVRIVMTPNSKNFVSPLTLSTLSRNEVLSSFTKEEKDNPTWNNHVELAKWSDLMIIAPATSNTISSMANAKCDNLLLATFLSCSKPVFIAPAMDLDMYNNSSNKQNIEKLTENGNNVLPVGSGSLASGLEGEGRMLEPEQIVEFIESKILNSLPLYGKNVLITAGPTYEKLDPVRFIGNNSSGKMGYYLAKNAQKLGANVKLIIGPTNLDMDLDFIETIRIESSDEMFNMVKKNYKKSDIVISAAAVSDFKPKSISEKKIKKKNILEKIEVVPTIDILSYLGKNKTKQYLVGFALETENPIENAKKKLNDKNLDAIILNSISDFSPISSDENKITFISSNNNIQYKKKSKDQVSKDIFEQIIKRCLKK
ncbi:MAG TPA: bifunctional phosphopantothenoylcysteine decarboxylase/phosphopantothenate--cysteine ligase CoaBC [Flavobacteriaceae bacterium]|jgi:phosphopantothenoylcysteine decarboxylase/phosphopantothenate--cysteine ligase|nr:bifunctional phosphopantothenoylcysteine decarboxylase/phosphopantothenate--cysteine ligase CoaBC [Flavobacteriaceae bacterium]HJO71067.1 bifunctional phosphopantothenoylcysteine decarboxylase/phosphopantothenate--cysteine ligase CoaBC [Flavobacteriaceae bacterium]|tara:strand:- start:7124 stop:8332 length:1209 start_codon:yes stop_codon:yes gene_type:complete